MSARDAVACVPRQLAYKLDALPVRIDNGTLVVGMPDAGSIETCSALELATRMPVRAVGLSREQIREGLREAYRPDPSAGDRGVDDAPAVQALDGIHAQAIEAHASDIHVEPAPDGGHVRMRVDGMLRDVQSLHQTVYTQVVSRIKLLSGMDIADRRQPQDGRYAIRRAGRAVDARVSSLPTLDGEKLVIRLLDPAGRSPRLEDVGMSERILARYRKFVRAPFGFVVVTGPTGSGKTTTLYGSLDEIGATTRSVCSVEDPVEMRIERVTQVHVNGRAGLTFPVVLRAFLRQDPNVIMIGEMRDPETAAVGIAAALSGQLVLTTLHSNDAPRTIERLIELGVARHPLAAALSVVVSQRLVRRLCVKCRVLKTPAAAARAAANPGRTWLAAGCASCGNTGYSGRAGVFELLEIDDDVRDAIVGGASSVSIAQLGRRNGYEPMIADGLAKVAAGITTVEELSRVLAWSA